MVFPRHPQILLQRHATSARLAAGSTYPENIALLPDAPQRNAVPGHSLLR